MSWAAATAAAEEATKQQMQQTMLVNFKLIN
jgi:hypothetical protein